jgi:hypothetical protein
MPVAAQAGPDLLPDLTRAWRALRDIFVLDPADGQE